MTPIEIIVASFAACVVLCMFVFCAIYAYRTSGFNSNRVFQQGQCAVWFSRAFVAIIAASSMLFWVIYFAERA